MTNHENRFNGTRTLYGCDFTHAHAIIIGIGGVGSWAAESLARTNVGAITLIDMDAVATSNINRQLVAQSSTLGQDKIAVMGARIADINPDCCVQLVDEFITPNNAAALLPGQAARQNTVILDCTDDSRAKLAIALHCRFNKLKLITAGGAGGKKDPNRLTADDLKNSLQDPLLAKLRHQLRDVGINTNLKEKFGITAVFSTEPAGTKRGNGAVAGGKLGCQGYGSAVVVTGAMGFLMSSLALDYFGRGKID